MAAKDWFTRKDGSMSSEPDKDQGVEFKPEAFKADMDKSLDDRLKAMQDENDKKLKPVLDMAEALRLERADRDKKLKDAEDKKKQDENAITDEDYLLDPKGTIERIVAQRTEGSNKATLMLAARMALKETFEDAEQFPYYSGDIKNKVDAMVSQQPLLQQSRSDVIQNCYKIVAHDHLKEIQEGKIKARNSAAALSSDGTGGHNGKGVDGDNETLSNEEKFVAGKMGISETDWLKSKRELTYV